MKRMCDRPPEGTIPILIDLLYSLQIDDRKRFVNKILDIPIGHVFDIKTSKESHYRFNQTQQIIDIVKNFNMNPNLPLCYNMLVEKYGDVNIQLQK